jgi:hypothetical protein
MARNEAGSDSGVVGNERLTAIAGGVLLVLILIELATVANLRALLSAHIVVGVLLAGPLAVKLGSTGYRALRYYSGAPAFVRRGPPRLPLRLLAIPLVALTLVVIASGIALTITGPDAAGPLIVIHNLAAVLWLPLIAVHAIAYVGRLPRLLGAELDRRGRTMVSGARLRSLANIMALVLGAVAAVLVLPGAVGWGDWSGLRQGVPGPVVAGVLLTFLVVAATRPRRWT